MPVTNPMPACADSRVPGPVSGGRHARPGTLVISLDFELYWGVRDRKSLDEYRANLLGVRRVVPALLDLFSSYDIHATWATVGFLFCETRDELLEALPKSRPDYRDRTLSAYAHLPQIGAGEADDPYHYGWSLIRQIRSHDSQEIASHTFSHYYCLEEGQNRETFEQDLAAAIAVAGRRGISIRSLVFPRNQVNRSYLEICAAMGIKAYRGVEPCWFQTPRVTRDRNLVARSLRLLDTYARISGDNAYDLAAPPDGLPLNIPSSRFLRPYSASDNALEGLRLRRIVSGMTSAARHGSVYHLWWHPHNFGIHTDKNLAFLEAILACYQDLNRTEGLESLTMAECAARYAGVQN